MLRRSLVVSLAVLAACRGEPQPAAPAVPLGEARLAVPGGSIWYKVSGTGRGVPVVLVHGGPGLSSYYLKPFEDLGTDRIVIRYDQLGGGKSDSLSDTTAMTIAHFVAELDSLRAHLKIQRMHVLGHSWGTILAAEYYRAHPEHVASLTFGSPVFDVPAFERHANELILTLSDSAQRAIAQADRTKRYDSRGYQNAITEFYGQYVFRRPVAAELDSTMTQLNGRIYNYMQGPSEFTITGTLKAYSVTPLLRGIVVPALVTVGEFDEVGPELARAHAAMIPNARFELLAGAAHITTWDARDANVRVVKAFLLAADSAEARAVR
jgi:proline iminopeptidase